MVNKFEISVKGLIVSFMAVARQLATERGEVISMGMKYVWEGDRYTEMH